MTRPRDEDRPLRFGFAFLPNYSLIAFAAAVEPLRMANRLSEDPLYRWTTVSADGGPVTASNGLALVPDGPRERLEAVHAIFVCGGVEVHEAVDEGWIRWLRGVARRGIGIGALCTGSYALARAGLLDGYRCTIHWENLASLGEEFPSLIASSELFEIDRDRFTCAGGTAALDMMLHLIGVQQDPSLAAAISDQFIYERIRGRHEPQRIPLRQHLGTGQPKLSRAVAVMEANLEEPLGLDEVAARVGLSRRQLERIFRNNLHCVPTRYYLVLRLNRARQLLRQTTLPVVDVALACGFVSAPHFSKCYRDLFGQPPRDERRPAAPAREAPA